MANGREMLIGLLGAVALTYVLAMAMDVLPNSVPFPIVALSGALILPLSALAAVFFVRARRPTTPNWILVIYFVACVFILFIGGLVRAQLQNRLEF